MRILALGLVTSFLALAAASAPVLPPGPCDAEMDHHTNPPIIGVKGNSVVWHQCNRLTQRWEPLVSSYNVFKKDHKCDPAYQFVDDDWFGTATENGKATLYRKSAPKNVSSVTLESDGYTLTIEFETPAAGYEPNALELCKIGGACCGLAPATNQDLQGKIPTEFEKFKDAAIKYGWFRKGQTPLRFETCRKIACAD